MKLCKTEKKILWNMKMVSSGSYVSGNFSVYQHLIACLNETLDKIRERSFQIFTKFYYIYLNISFAFNRVAIYVPHRGVSGIFFRRGKVVFPDFFPGVKCFFPVENSNFGRPKTNFSGFEKWKAKKKKKSYPHFL